MEWDFDTPIPESLKEIARWACLGREVERRIVSLTERHKIIPAFGEELSVLRRLYEEAEVDLPCPPVT